MLGKGKEIKNLYAQYDHLHVITGDIYIKMMVVISRQRHNTLF